MKESDLRHLDAQTREYVRNVGGKAQNRKISQSFLQWYSAPHPSTWKISWSDHEVAGTAIAVKEQTASEYGHKQPHTCRSVGKNRVRRNDWLLTFMFSKRGVRSIQWVYVDFIVKISPKEKRYYERDWPYHAVQVNPLSKYPLPPFQITREFRKSLGAAIRAFMPDRIKNSKTDRPSERLLGLIAKELKSR